MHGLLILFQLFAVENSSSKPISRQHSCLTRSHDPFRRQVKFCLICEAWAMSFREILTADFEITGVVFREPGDRDCFASDTHHEFRFIPFNLPIIAALMGKLKG